MSVAEWKAKSPRQRATILGAAEPLGDPASLGADLNLESFILRSRPVDAAFANLVTGGSIKATIEGASTLTLNVRDSERFLLRSRLLTDRVELFAAGLEWELTGVSKQGDDFDLVFEDLRVAALRRQDKPRKVARDKYTRAQFIKMLNDELPADIRPTFVCPELKVRQPIAKAHDRPSRKAKDDDRHRGIADDANLNFRGAKATQPQLRLAERCLDVADSHNAPEVVMQALAAIGINETAFRNVTGSSDGLSSGVIQLQDSIAAQHGIDNMNVEETVNFFLSQGAAISTGAIAYARAHPSYGYAQIARDVWGGQGFPLSTWTRWDSEVKALLSAYGGASSSRVKDDREQKQYEFSRGKPGGPKGEDSWACSLRLVEEVGWRRFVVRDRFFYVSEDDLIRSRPRAHITEGEGGVDNIDFDIDSRTAANQATVTCRAKLWKAPPGSVIVVKDDMGDLVKGRWLVSEIDRPIFSLNSSIELRRASALLKEKAEPAPETVVRPRGGGVAAGSGRSAKAAAVYRAAKKISAQKRGYFYGGGHKALSAISPTEALDCSSSTSLALWMAGIMEGSVAWTSGMFASDYGEPGPGEFITIWAHSGHVFIEGNLPDIGYWRFDTSQNGSSGPRLVTSQRTHSGFTPRHPS